MDERAMLVVQPVTPREGESPLSAINEAMKKALVCARYAGSESICLTMIVPMDMDDMDIKFTLDERGNDES